MFQMREKTRAYGAAIVSRFQPRAKDRIDFIGKYAGTAFG